MQWTGILPVSSVAKQQGAWSEQTVCVGGGGAGPGRGVGPTQVLGAAPVHGEALESALLIGQPRVPQKDALSPAACDLEATFHLPEEAWSHDQASMHGVCRSIVTRSL